MEEDIKVLEELINGAKEFNQYNGNKYYKAIENLIKRNKKLQEKLNNYEKQLDLDYVDNNYIPKSKVREKIEELEKFIESKRILPVDIIEDQNRNVKWKIEALQELLEGDDK